VRPPSKQDVEVFVSHASKDRSFVKRLLKVFKQNRIHYWFSETHIPGAMEWHDEIGRAMDHCNWFLLVLTPNAVKSMWVKRELLYALRQKRYRRRIIPAVFRDCKYELLSWTLADFEFIDFRKDFDIACKRLLRLWGRR